MLYICSTNLPNTSVLVSPKNVQRAEWLLVVTMLASALWMIGNLIAGIPPTGPDSMDHMQWITQFTQQVDAGVCYPRWMAQSFGGFGLPIFYIYPPLAYYSAWFVHLFNQNWQAEDLYRIISVLLLVGSALTAYLYFLRYAPRRQAIIAALIYTALPYRYWDVMIRCAYSEAFVFLFIPLLFIVIDNIIENIHSTRSEFLLNTSLLASLTALLIFTSAPSVAVLSVAVPLYCFVKWRIHKAPLRPILTQLLGASALGALCSSIWILPAFATRPLVQTNLAYDPGFGRMYDIIGIFFVNRSNLIYVPMLMAVIGYSAVPIFWLERANIPKKIRPWLWLGVAIVFLQLPISWPLWNVIPMLRVAQFSSRFGILMCIVLPMAYVSVRDERRRVLLLLSISVLTLYSNIHAVPSLKESWAFGNYDNHHPPTMDAFEYLPNSVEPGGWKTHLLGLKRTTPEVSWQGDSAAISNITRAVIRTSFDVNCADSVTVTIARFAFPDWKIFADGREIAYTAAEHGFIRATMPPGCYRAILTLTTSPAERTGAIVSLAAASCIVLLFGISLVLRKNS